MSIFSKQCICSILLGVISIHAHAQVLERPDGNFYELVHATGITWQEAEVAAEQRTFHGQNGHLATATSREENDFINSLRELNGFSGQQFWLGGFQLPNQINPRDGWTWINGEGLIPTSPAEEGYSNWIQHEPDLPPVFNEPNDWPDVDTENGEEDFLAIGLFNQNGWNDVPNAGNWESDIGGYIVEYEKLIVKMDVHPGSPQNPVNLKSQGLLPVALFSQPGFQAEDIDASKIAFGKTGTETAPVKFHLVDLNHDHVKDLMLFFKVRDSGLSPGDTRVLLSGKTRNDIHFRAEDLIQIVSPR